MARGATTIESHEQEDDGRDLPSPTVGSGSSRESKSTYPRIIRRTIEERDNAVGLRVVSPIAAHKGEPIRGRGSRPGAYHRHGRPMGEVPSWSNREEEEGIFWQSPRQEQMQGFMYPRDENITLATMMMVPLEEAFPTPPQTRRWSGGGIPTPRTQWTTSPQHRRGSMGSSPYYYSERPTEQWVQAPTTTTTTAHRILEEQRQRHQCQQHNREGTYMDVLDSSNTGLPPPSSGTEEGVAFGMNNIAVMIDSNGDSVFLSPYGDFLQAEQGLELDVSVSPTHGASAPGATSSHLADVIHYSASNDDPEDAQVTVVTPNDDHSNNANASHVVSTSGGENEKSDSRSCGCWLQKNIRKRPVLFVVVCICLVGLVIALGVGVGILLSSRKGPDSNGDQSTDDKNNGPSSDDACDLIAVGSQCRLGDESSSRTRTVPDCFMQKHQQRYEHIKTSWLLQIEPDFEETSLSCEASNVAIWALASAGREFTTSRLFLNYYVLATLYFTTSGDSWLRNDNWLAFNKSICAWQGIVCNSNIMSSSTENETVVGIELSRLGLIGTIPSQLGLLTTLVDLSLSRNTFLGGRIPSHLGALKMLDTLFLEGNALSGSLPTEILKNENLAVLRLNGNLITGTLPTELGLATSLVNLNLGSNMIAGIIPREIGWLHSLENLDISMNDLNGTLPSTLGNLTNLANLVVSNNALEGTIPSELSLSNSLVRIDMDTNRLNGTIPTNMGDFQALRFIFVSANSLTGPLPSEMGQLNSLEILKLDGNNLSGFIPDEVCGLLDSRLRILGSEEDRCRTDRFGGLKCPYVECCESCPSLVEGPSG